MDSTCTLSQQLVNDLGEFIGVTLAKEKLSASAEKRRSELHQNLQIFIVTEVEIPDEEEYEDPAPIRSCSQLSVQSTSGQSDEGSKVNITFKQLQELSPKLGPLWRKEKGLLREVWRKYLCGIFDQKLILFHSEKDVKPTCINIQGYVARPAPNVQRDEKKKAITFEIICPGKKDYQFFARAVKDMEQWVAVICRISIQHIDISNTPNIDRRLVVPIDDPDTETYDDAIPTTISHDDGEEEFYDDIEETKQQKPVPQILLPSRKTKDEENEEEELYNDIEEYEEPSAKHENKPVMWHTESRINVKDRRSPAPIPTEPEEEEEDFYHDIAEYQNREPTKIKQFPTKKIEKDEPPPLPARRPLPSLPSDKPSEDEEDYEDMTSYQGHTKIDQHLQASKNKMEDANNEEEEEIYDDVGNPNPKEQSPSVSVSHEEEPEEIYDDVGETESSHQKNSQFFQANENTKSIANFQNSHYKIGEIKNQNKTSGIIEKQSINVTVKIRSKQMDDKKPSMKETNSIQNVNTNQSFLQRNCLRQNGNVGLKMKLKATNHQYDVSKQPIDAVGTEETKSTGNQVSKGNTNVKNISSKFNQPTNKSFLHRNSSSEEKGNVHSILQRLSKTGESEETFNSQKSNNSSSRFNTSTTSQSMVSASSVSDTNLEKGNSNFQNALKKIEASLVGGGNLIGDQAMINSNKPTRNQSSLHTSIESTSNRQNRPLPPKPTLPPPNELTLNFSRNASPSRGRQLPSPSSESSTNSRNQLSLESPDSRVNSPSLQISVSPHQISPRDIPRNKPDISKKPTMNINITLPPRNTSGSPRTSPNRNKPNGLPVPIPTVPTSPTSPPELPPRSYLK